MTETIVANKWVIYTLVMPLLATFVGPVLIDKRQWLALGCVAVLSLWLGTTIFTASYSGFSAIWRSALFPVLFLLGAFVTRRQIDRQLSDDPPR